MKLSPDGLVQEFYITCDYTNNIVVEFLNRLNLADLIC